jgi:tetratricopeptide (TPR) repeat protein
MLRLFIFFFMLSSLPGVLCAETGTGANFEQANEYFSRSEFEKATQLYEELTQNHGFSAPVLFNLANSYAQQGLVGRAILNYERAAVLAPSDPDIMGNLEKVRKENGLFLEPPTGIDKIFYKLTLNQWAALIVTGLALSAVALLTSLKLTINRAAIVITSSTCLLLISFGLTGTVLRYTDFNPSIVLSTEAKLLVSPFESSASVGAIMEGRRVFQIKDHGNYTYVKDSSGRKGWLLASFVESVGGR